MPGAKTCQAAAGRKISSPASIASNGLTPIDQRTIQMTSAAAPATRVPIGGGDYNASAGGGAGTPPRAPPAPPPPAGRATPPPPKTPPAPPPPEGGSSPAGMPQ